MLTTCNRNHFSWAQTNLWLFPHSFLFGLFLFFFYYSFSPNSSIILSVIRYRARNFPLDLDLLFAECSTRESADSSSTQIIVGEIFHRNAMKWDKTWNSYENNNIYRCKFVLTNYCRIMCFTRISDSTVFASPSLSLALYLLLCERRTLCTLYVCDNPIICLFVLLVTAVSLSFVNWIHQKYKIQIVIARRGKQLAINCKWN